MAWLGTEKIGPAVFPTDSDLVVVGGFYNRKCQVSISLMNYINQTLRELSTGSPRLTALQNRIFSSTFLQKFQEEWVSS